MQVGQSSFKYQASKSERTLAHWEYEPYEWEYFVWGEWRRVKAEIQLRYRLLLGAVAVFLVTLTLTTLFNSDFLSALIILGVLGVPSLGVVAATYKINYEIKRSWYKELHRATPEVTITADAVIYGNPDYTSTRLIKSLQDVVVRTRVDIEDGDFGMIAFRVNTLSSNRGPEIINVLIPKGKEDEAYALVEEFRSL